MKILHLIFQFKTGGAENMLIDIMREQVNMGHDVSFMVVNNEIEEPFFNTIPPAVRTMKLGRPRGSRNPYYLFKLNRAILAANPDVVHIHNHDLPRLLLSTILKKTVYTVHDLHVSMRATRGLKMIAISEAVRDDVLARVPDAQIKTIPNGIPIANITPRAKGEKNTMFRIVQAGRLDHKKKGQDLLIKALKLVPEAAVDFIGDGKSRGYLEQLAREQGVAQRVRFLGNQGREYVYSHLRDYDLMCHPARYEGFGLVIAEAMAAEVPVAVPRGGGPWEVCQQGKLGFVFEPESPRSIAQAIKRAMKQPAPVERAREYVKAHFSITSMVREYVDYYSHLSH